MAPLTDNSALFKAIFSTSWETLDQNFYTRLAQTIDPIDSTITFYAEILSSGILKAFDKSGKDVTDKDELVALLQNPNEYQNFKEFIKEWLYYHYSHGWNYVLPLSTASGYEKRIKVQGVKTKLYNLDPDQVVWANSIIGNILSLFGVNKSMSLEFEYKPLGLARVNYDNVIPFIDVRQNPEKPYIGISRLLSLRQQIQNYSLALQGKENLIKRTGSQLISLDVSKNDDFGLDSIIGTGQTDDDGNPITTTHKEKLEEQLRETGLGNGSKGVMFSTLPLKVTPLSAGLENIDFDKLGGQDARQMMNKFNVPKEFQNLILSDVAKYDEKNSSMKLLVQNIIVPLAQSFCEKVSSYFNWENTLTLDYMHLPVFTENEATKVETKQKIYDLYFKMYQDKSIDEKTFKQKLQEHGITETNN